MLQRSPSRWLEVVCIGDALSVDSRRRCAEVLGISGSGEQAIQRGEHPVANWNVAMRIKKL